MTSSAIQPDRSTLTAGTAELDQARELSAEIRKVPDGAEVRVVLGGDEESIRVPKELASMLKRLLADLGEGRTVQVGSLPEELTTTSAAEQLGISRPTLMRMIESGEIISHKVGTHTRLNSSDVMAAKRARLARQRAALEELTQLSDELGEQ